MPTVPLYNQGATEEAGLTRAKRRVVKAMNSGIAKLTEKPDEDLTNGSADQIANRLITQFEDLTGLFRQINAYFGSGESGEIYLENQGDVVKAISVVITATKVVGRILRTSKILFPMMRYMDLGILGDLKSAQTECHDAAVEAFATLRQVYFEDTNNYNDLPADQSIGSFGFEDEYDPFEPTGNTPPEEDYSIQSDPTGGLPSTSTRTKRRGRPIKEGSATDLLRLANRALRDLQAAADDRQMREEGRQLLFQQEQLDREQGRVDEPDDTSVLTPDSGEPMGRIQFITRIDRASYQNLLDVMSLALSKAMDLLDLGYTNFNAHRQQKVRKSAMADTADVSNAIKTGNGLPGRVKYPGEVYTMDVRPGDRNATKEEIMMRGGFTTVQGTAARFYGVTPHIQNIYRVGGSSNILYEREGLPRFL